MTPAALLLNRLAWQHWGIGMVTSAQFRPGQAIAALPDDQRELLRSMTSDDAACGAVHPEVFREWPTNPAAPHTSVSPPGRRKSGRWA